MKLVNPHTKVAVTVPNKEFAETLMGMGYAEAKKPAAKKDGKKAEAKKPAAKKDGKKAEAKKPAAK